ncbi:MAG: SDR family oxidoreductase [Bacteroidales bacterium]|nr:SDR family oxidoreductase [Bacteroidales bacterium]
MSNSIHDLFDLSGKIALVTGCKNLGFDAGKALVELGATVILTRRKEENIKESAQRMSQETGIEVFGKTLDVTKEIEWKRVVQEVLFKFGRIDILINNAGGRKPVVNDGKNMDDITNRFLEGRTLDEWKYGVDVNLTSIFLGCRAVVPHMKNSGSGKIINISSIDGMLGRDLRIYLETGLSPTVPDYIASKGWVINLTRGLAVALASYGIYVNCISPGGFSRNQPETFIKNYESRVPLGRMGKDGIDIKGAVAFLASSASDYVDAHNLVVNGGWIAW